MTHEASTSCSGQAHKKIVEEPAEWDMALHILRVEAEDAEAAKASAQGLARPRRCPRTEPFSV